MEGRSFEPDYTLCFVIKEDEVRMNAEKKQIEQEKAEKREKKRNMKKLLRKRQASLLKQNMASL